MLYYAGGLLTLHGRCRRRMPAAITPGYLLAARDSAGHYHCYAMPRRCIEATLLEGRWC